MAILTFGDDGTYPNLESAKNYASANATESYIFQQSGISTDSDITWYDQNGYSSTIIGDGSIMTKYGYNNLITFGVVNGDVTIEDVVFGADANTGSYGAFFTVSSSGTTTSSTLSIRRCKGSFKAKYLVHVLSQSSVDINI